jgi:hypothetical protein
MSDSIKLCAVALDCPGRIDLQTAPEYAPADLARPGRPPVLPVHRGRAAVLSPAKLRDYR